MSPTPAPSPTVTATPTAYLDNPAAQYCAEKAGTSKTLKDAQGADYALCSFEYAVIEEWTLYLNANGRNTAAAQAFITHPSECSTPTIRYRGPFTLHSAADYCAKVGGTELALTDGTTQTTFCAFPDRSLIEEWTLYRGPNDPLNAALSAAIAPPAQP